VTRGTLIVFLKAPRAGRVKTRLAKSAGAGRAAAVFAHLTRLTLSRVDGPWKTVLAIDQNSDLFGWDRLWPRRFERVAQGSGGLGIRMKRAFEFAPRGPVVIVGADAPGLQALHIRKAFQALGGADAVIGPAHDGGYWLIGLARRKAAPRLFENVRWSSEHALADTLATLPAKFKVNMLPQLRDVDDDADLKALQPFLRSCG
jgi:rSAM/selenodomain-associated transferase 1